MVLKQPVQIVIILSVVVLAGCSTANFYHQAIAGQWALLRDRQPTPEVLAEPATPTPLQEGLSRVERIREFAAEALGLPVGETYGSYRDLGREALVWNLLAAPADSLALKAWCYPLVGCQTYRGYFRREQALDSARALDQEGWDTWVAAIDAYSSLGWFDDPVLNTFVYWPEDQLAGLLFHELSHKVVYIAGDTAFNESYATAVEEAGLALYLEQFPDPALAQAADERRRIKQGFTALVMATAEDLRRLYQEPDITREGKHLAKAGLLAELRRRYHLLRQSWGEPTAYLTFFDEGLNNARIAGVGTYHRWVPAFRQLLANRNHNFKRFHKAVQALASLPPARRRTLLDQLMPERLAPESGNFTMAVDSVPR